MIDLSVKSFIVEEVTGELVGVAEVLLCPKSEPLREPNGFLRPWEPYNLARQHSVGMPYTD